MSSPADSGQETFSPWSIVNLVFRHLADEGLHPVLGETGDPSVPAAALLRALGITPSAEGNRQVTTRVSGELAHLRDAFEALSQGENTRGLDSLCDPGHRPF